MQKNRVLIFTEIENILENEKSEVFGRVTEKIGLATLLKMEIKKFIQFLLRSIKKRHI